MPQTVPPPSSLPSDLAPALRGTGLPPLTLLLVEDSRLAADTIRQMARRLGMRLRRAQSLHDAQAHLRVYRPDIALVDIGMPDGSGVDLIRDLNRPLSHPIRIVATSGDPEVEHAARAAGAQEFIVKPSPLPALITALLGPFAAALPVGETAHRGPQCASGSVRNAGRDPLALRDDLRRLCDLLDGDDDPERLIYIAQFMRSIARLVDDHAFARSLDVAATSLDRTQMRDAVQLPAMSSLLI